MATVDDQQHALYLVLEDAGPTVRCAHHSCRFRYQPDRTCVVEEAFASAAADHDAPPEPDPAAPEGEH